MGAISQLLWVPKDLMAHSSVALPDDLREFVEFVQWTYARTMPEWPEPVF